MTQARAVHFLFLGLLDLHVPNNLKKLKTLQAYSSRINNISEAKQRHPKSSDDLHLTFQKG